MRHFFGALLSMLCAFILRRDRAPVEEGLTFPDRPVVPLRDAKFD